MFDQEQKDIIAKYGKMFESWVATDDGKQIVGEHRNHQKFFKDRLSEANLSKMTEQEFAEMYKQLWASNVFGNKDWYVKNKLINRNGLEKIKQELTKLLYGVEDFILRYNHFRKNVSGLAVSSLSEILHFVFPDKYCLWNDKPKTILPFLGLNILPEKFFKYQIDSGEEYYQCVQALENLKNELLRFGIKDFVDLDILFHYIFYRIYKDTIPTEPKETTEQRGETTKSNKIIIDSHESAEFYILELGKMLGYIPYTVDQSKTFNGQKLGETALLNQIPAFAGERDLNSAREIDVIWFGDDENPKLCFEVEHSTDIVHGLNRLSQLKHLYVKFFVVAIEDRRTKYEIEMRKFPFRTMKDRFGFISYDELSALHELTVPFQKLKTRLLKE